MYLISNLSLSVDLMRALTSVSLGMNLVQFHLPRPHLQYNVSAYVYCNILTFLSKSPYSDFDGVNLTIIPNTIIRSGTDVILKVTVTAVPIATEIRLSRRDGPFFSSSDSTINRPLGRVTINVSVKPACSSLIIEWTLHDSGSSEITRYTLRWRSAEDSTWTQTKALTVSDYVTLTQQGGNYTLTRLDSGKLYSVQVEATNSVGSTTSEVNETTLMGLCKCKVYVDKICIFYAFSS